MFRGRPRSRSPRFKHAITPLISLVPVAWIAFLGEPCEPSRSQRLGSLVDEEEPVQSKAAASRITSRMGKVYAARAGCDTMGHYLTSLPSRTCMAVVFGWWVVVTLVGAGIGSLFA